MKNGAKNDEESNSEEDMGKEDEEEDKKSFAELVCDFYKLSASLKVDL